MRVYVNCITTAVESIISGWDAAVDSGWTVEKECEFNTDPNRVPWVGIYTPDITFDPRRSNIISPFVAILSIPIYIQTMDYRNVPNAIMELNDFSGEVYTSVSCYRDLLNTVNIIKGLTLEPFDRIIQDENVLVSNKLTIIAEVFA